VGTLLTGLLFARTRRYRFMTLSEASARRSMVTSGVAVIIFSFAIGITGMHTFRLNPHLGVPDQALPWLAMNVLPPWLAAFVVVAVVSGMSSAANGNAAAAGTFFVRHIYPLATGRYPRQPVRAVRWALACAFFGSTVLALCTGSIVGFVVKFLPLTVSGLAVIILLARFWKRATWQGALAALVTTPAVSLALVFLPLTTRFRDNPTIPATLVGVVAHVAISLVTPAPRVAFDAVAEALDRERQAIEGESPAKPPVAVAASHAASLQ
jgi:solute:Na+ symporter, SSS family